MKHWDLNRVQLFLEIVRAGNLTRAAERLGLRKSKLSRDLLLLEQELGVQLVYRTTRQFRLTHSGQQIVEVASRQLEPLVHFLTEMVHTGSEASGHIRMTCPEDVGQLVVVPIVDEFRRSSPRVQVEVRFTSEVMDLVAERIDLGVRIGALPNASIKRRKVGAIRMNGRLFQGVLRVASPPG